ASISTRREDSDILRQTHDSAAASCRPELVETAAAIIWNSVSVYGFATGNLPVATLEQRQSQQAYRALDHESPSHGGVTIDSKASRPEPRRHSAADTGSHVDLDGVILGHMSLLVMNLLPYLDGSLLARQHTEPRVAGRGHRATAEFAAHLQLAPLRRHDRKAAVPWRQLANGRLGHVVELVVFEAHGGVKPRGLAVNRKFQLQGVAIGIACRRRIACRAGPIDAAMRKFGDLRDVRTLASPNH